MLETRRKVIEPIRLTSCTRYQIVAEWKVDMYQHLIIWRIEIYLVNICPNDDILTLKVIFDVLSATCKGVGAPLNNSGLQGAGRRGTTRPRCSRFKHECGYVVKGSLVNLKPFVLFCLFIIMCYLYLHVYFPWVYELSLERIQHKSARQSTLECHAVRLSVCCVRYRACHLDHILQH